MPPKQILVLGGAELRATAGRAATEAGLGCDGVETLGELFARLAANAWSATVLSLGSTHVDEAVAERIAAEGRSGAVILAAPRVSLERALLMERIGAVALLREPVDAEELVSRLRGVADEGARVALPPLRPGPVGDGDPEPELVGHSPAMGEVFETVARVARSSSTVLVTGESGTGKEVVARALHAASDRSRGPFVPVNCAAIPEHLLESELFGHEEGAFTGAVARRIGRFERADGGTLFLDEIGDMSLVLQAKLLRVIEERAVERLGGASTLPIDVRIVAATNQELGRATADGRFREDLLYRLAVVELHLPPLRDRGSDIRELALHFAAGFARQHGKPITGVTERALRRLETAPWPGNVRQLRNVVDRAVLLAHGPVVRTSDLRTGAAAPRASAWTGAPHEGGYAPTLSLEEVESDHIRRVLTELDGQIGEAANVLGVHRNTLTRKLREYGIEARPRRSAGT